MADNTFVSYVAPGVYTRSTTETNVAQVVSGLRIPVIIGVGQEDLDAENVELVRGSSASIDQRINNEDVSLSWVVDSTNPNNIILGAQDGTRTQFKVKNFPVVDGRGSGRVTNNVSVVQVFVNGLPVAVSALNGQKGLVTLQVPTNETDVVAVSYFFHRGDTAFKDDLSSMVTSSQAQLMSPAWGPFNIALGTSDTFTFKVKGVSYTVIFAPGNGVTTATLKTQIDVAGIPNLGTAVFTDNAGFEHLMLIAPDEIEILNGNANGILGWSAFTKTNRNKVFTVFNRPITDGTGSGLTTTDPSDVVVKVNNQQVIPTSVDGQNGNITLPLPPPPGAQVTVEYFANTWQDTFDYLPNTLITQVLRCGIAPNRADYIDGTDFVVSNPSNDVSIIHWGTSFTISNLQTTPGGTVFGENQITGLLVDDKMYLGLCDNVTDTSTIPATVSTTDFLLPEIPTTGNGRNTTLGSATFNSVTNTRQDLVTNRPDLIVAYAGRNLSDALNRAPVKVIYVDGASRRIKLSSPIPPDWKVFATFYYNRIVDDSYNFENKVAGTLGVGQYEIYAINQDKNLYHIRFGTKTGLSQIVQWPRGVENIPDAFHVGFGTPVSEVVTVTFGMSTAKNAAYTNKGAGPYSFYNPNSATWVTKLNGVNYTTNLVTATKAFLVSKPVTPIQTGIDAGKITIAPSANVLNLTIDGVAVAVTLTTGNRTPAQIITEINAAIDATVPFAPGPNNLASSHQIGGATGDVFFIIRSFSTPAALPAGFDHKATVKIEQGSVETVLGFSTYQTASGSPTTINKPATLVGDLAGPFNITAGLNDKFDVRVNGSDFSITLPNGPAVTAAAIAAAINGVVASLASVGTLDNLNKIRLTSSTNQPNSSLLILSGNANTVLGFTANTQASQTLVNVQEVVNSLLSTVGFLPQAVSYPSTIDGRTFLTIESLTTGAATSDISFVNSVNSAFNITTGLNIVVGTDGDVGEDSKNIYNVTSSNPGGSEGTGVPGQTYTDGRTGLRFTVLPASTGNYTTNGSFTMNISPVFNVNPGVPFYSIPGMETTVSNTVGVVVDDLAQLRTFHPGGVEPANGDLYYLSYKYKKQDFSTKLYRQLKTIQANFGNVSAENRVTLASYLSITNGALLVAIKQVLKEPNSNQASDSSFIAALDELKTPLPGNIKPDIIVPLATTSAVYSKMTQHVEVMSLIQNQSERIGFFGFAPNTVESTAMSVARAINSNRMIGYYPDACIITLEDELGQDYETVVDGTFFAAAVAGAVVSPSRDVATPYTRTKLQGITRIPRILDAVTANQVAQSGLTVLEDLDPIIRIRQGLTTNMTNRLTQLPTVTQIADFVQQQTRIVLDSFIGTKFLATRTQEISVVMTNLYKTLVEAEIIATFTGISSTVDPNDPVVILFESYYQPIFPLLYIICTFNIRAQL